ncbi:hypothetical protein ECPA3_1886, partial [Escherichia coli PA3]
MALTRSHFSFD